MQKGHACSFYPGLPEEQVVFPASVKPAPRTGGRCLLSPPWAQADTVSRWPCTWNKEKATAPLHPVQTLWLSLWNYRLQSQLLSQIFSLLQPQFPGSHVQGQALQPIHTASHAAYFGDEVCVQGYNLERVQP